MPPRWLRIGVWLWLRRRERGYHCVSVGREDHPINLIDQTARTRPGHAVAPEGDRDAAGRERGQDLPAGGLEPEMSDEIVPNLLKRPAEFRGHRPGRSVDQEPVALELEPDVLGPESLDQG
ncbi:MAG TPA: hypothetical protein VFA26_18540 [Gemmataceae bacterium]|nr:hypothetical protein [Gemmataceae bacterium]